MKQKAVNQVKVTLKQPDPSQPSLSESSQDQPGLAQLAEQSN